jgi:long-chain acyl-CoA synthetase
VLILPDLIERQAQRNPKRAALIFNDQTLTYAQLQDRVLRCAAVLKNRGIKAGDTFGMVLRNSPEFVITFFALVRLGAYAVPVNFLLKADEISTIFEDAGVVGVLTQPAFLSTVLEAQKKLPRLRDVFVTGNVPSPHPSPDLQVGRGPGGSRGEASSAGVLSFEQFMASCSATCAPPREPDPNDVAMIIYTSGTTGKPKGAMLTHRNFISNVEQCLGRVDIYPKDTFMCLLPMFHSFAWTVCVLIPLYVGCRVVIVESIQPFGEVIKQIMRHRVSIFVAVPPIYAALLRVPFWRPMKLINPIRMCISGASALPPVVHEKFEAKFKIPLMEGYGLTEASPVISLNMEKKRIPGSVGQALPGIEIRLVGEKGETLPSGEVGEICVRGANTMKGYFHLAAATREAFLDSKAEWLRTGDVGHLDVDGYLFISDRKKDLVIVKGLNVYPKEVEDVLLSHPAVLEAAVVGVPDETGDEIIRGYVTLKEGHPADRQELLKLCRNRLAAYKCPKDLEIRKELPKNTLGKILKRELRTLT